MPMTDTDRRIDPAKPIGTVPITLTISGQRRSLQVEPWTTLPDLLT